MKVVEGGVWLTFRNFFPLIAARRVEPLQRLLGSRTRHDEKGVFIAGLRSGRRRRVLVLYEVFSIDDRDYCVHLKSPSVFRSSSCN